MGTMLGHAALRLATGAYILNAGIGKISLDKDHAAGLQATGAHAFPWLMNIEAEKFGKLLSTAEITLGSLLLAPFVPSRIAGLGLATFSGALLRVYLKTPGLTLADGVRPSPAGSAMAKDSWMFAIAVALITDRRSRRPAGAVTPAGGPGRILPGPRA